MLQRNVETSSFFPENQHTKHARNKSFSCSFGVGPRWQGPVSEMVMTGALARYDRPRLWRLHGDGHFLIVWEASKSPQNPEKQNMQIWKE